MIFFVLKVAAPTVGLKASLLNRLFESWVWPPTNTDLKKRREDCLTWQHCLYPDRGKTGLCGNWAIWQAQ